MSRYKNIVIIDYNDDRSFKDILQEEINREIVRELRKLTFPDHPIIPTKPAKFD
jgi:hypothetical protein